MNSHVLRKNAECAQCIVCGHALVRAYLLPYLRHGLGHEREQQTGAYTNALKQVVQYSRKSRHVLLALCENPRSRFVDILVCTGNYLEYLLQRLGKLRFLDEL